LLDEDLAVRTASLGRVYSDLGFEQLALAEGAKSLAHDPGNYSGHRFLADTYSALPRHEVARVSELLQSQLLAPLSLTPVSPRLAESNLFILEGAGPHEPAFNEFNSLFNRNRIAVQVSGVTGGNSVLGDEATVSGIWNAFAFSVGQFHYDTKGFRENNHQDRNIQNAFVQIQMSAATAIQAELRSEENRSGDLTLLFHPENFSPDQRVRARSHVVRVGFRHTVNPQSQVIASVYRATRSEAFSASVDEFGLLTRLGASSETDSYTAEVRHLLRAGRWNVTSGMGHFSSARARIETVDLEMAFGEVIFSSTEDFSDNPQQTNAYVYGSVELPNYVTLTLGTSVDFFDSLLFNRNQFNPKLGVMWIPTPSTTLRLAAFRTLHRALVSSQTIEPTQIVGFNQFFADFEGESAVRYGVGADHKAGDQIFVGAEYAWRDLTAPIELFEPERGTVVNRFPRSEQFGRSYFYWAARRTLALTAEYLFEDFHRQTESAGIEGLTHLRTHRVRLGGRYFSPIGWHASGAATRVNQHGSFTNLAFPRSGKDQFWVADMSVGYRLPRRYGRLTFEVKNVFDQRFSFQDTDPGNPVIKPGRLLLFGFTFGAS
jgi:hypothetical protein